MPYPTSDAEFGEFDAALGRQTPAASYAPPVAPRLPAPPPTPAAAPLARRDDPAPVPRESAAYGQAFGHYLRTGVPAAALTTGTDTQGGYLAPPAFVAEVVKTLTAASWFRRLARTYPPTAAPVVRMPRRTAESTPFVWSSEIAPPTPDAALAFGEMTLTLHPLTGELEVSRGLVQAGPLADQFVRDEIAENVAKSEEAAFVAGDGIGKPHGLFVPHSEGLPASRDVAVTLTDYTTFTAAMFTLKAAYLRSESLRVILHPTALAALAAMKDTAGAPVWPDLFAHPDGRPRVAGVPVELSDFAPAGTGGGGAYQSGDYFAVLGDLQQYAIVDDGDLRVGRFDDHHYASRNKVGYIVRRKVDGAARVAEAFVRLKVA